MPASRTVPSVAWLKCNVAALGSAGATAGYFAGLLFRHALLASALLLLFNAVQGAATPLTVWAMAGLINAVGSLTNHAAAPWPSTLPWLVALLVAALLRSLSAADPFLSTAVRERVDTAMHRQLFAKAVSLPLATFEHPDYYTKLETGRQALGGSLVIWVGEVSWLISHAVGVAGLLVVYARVNLLLAAVLCLTTVVQGILGVRLSRAFAQRNLQNSPLRREMSYWAGLLASREAAPELRLFGLGPHLLTRWRALFLALLTDLLTLRRQLGRQTVRQAAVREGIGLVALLYLLLLGLHGAISLGALVGLLYGLSRFRDLVENVSGTAQRLGRLWFQLGCLRDFLALPEERSPAPGHQPPRPLQQGVEFREVSFTYPGAARPALHGVNLLLRPGEHVALVGENGAGKTTLVRLLLGLYRPTAGRILVDGVDLAELDLPAWRQEATGIFQDFVRYPTSVLENIAYADVSLLADGDFQQRPVPEPVVTAARRSAAAEFVERLPQGYATLLGKEFDGAVDLSAGQWQRLALARAYLRDAQVVVLDEPTAALDPRAEIEVYRQFDQAAAGRTAVFISHRLGSAKLASRIVVLHEGRIVEEGSHAALLQADSAYARMYRLQASWYASSPAAEDGEAALQAGVAATPAKGPSTPASEAPPATPEHQLGERDRERLDQEERSDGRRRSDPYRRRWRYVPQLLRLCWQTGPGLFLARLGFQVAAGLYPLVGVALLRGLVTAAQQAVEGRTALAVALAWGVALAAFTLVQARVNTAGNVVSLRFEQRLRLTMEERCYALVQAMPLEELERPERHDTLARARRGVEQRLSNTLAFVGMATRDLVTALSLLVYLAQLHWALPLLLAAGTTPAVVLRVRQLGQEFLLQRALTSEERRFGVYETLLTGRAAAAELRLFGFGPWMTGHADRLRRRMATERQRLAVAGSVRATVSGACNAVAYGAALALGVALLVAGLIGIGAAAALFYAIEGLQQAYLDTLWEVAVISNDLRYLQDFFDFLAVPKLDLRAGRELPGPIGEGITFEHVSFTYPGSHQPALRDLCLSLRPGEHVALVGENGAGKTTLVKLLLGLYRPTAGRILVDGVDLGQLAPAGWHRRGGAVFQHFLRYQTSIRENIAFGWVERMDDATRLAETARRSGAAAVAAALPLGLDTPLGKEFHDGADLSLGQWQKLAIARAYFRPAEVLVLDEPASALDANAEADVYDHFAEMAQATTAVLVSHRLGSCKIADRILLLQEGRLVEEGTHQALLAAGGRYAELYQMQAAWYR